jgi:hypothetical protein
MKMKQPVFAILVVWLMMSACSKQDEQVTVAEKPAVPATAPVVAEQAKPAPATEAPAPVQAAAPEKKAEPAPPFEKPQAKAADGALSHEAGAWPVTRSRASWSVRRGTMSASATKATRMPKSVWWKK